MKRVNESKVEVDFESVRSLLEFNDCVVLVPRDSFLWNYKRGIQRVLQCSQFPSIYIHSLSPTLVLLYRYFYITKHPLYEESDREDMVAYMTEKLQNSGKVKGKVLDIQLCKHKSIYFYQEHDQTYMKVIMQFPNDVTLAREVFRVCFIDPAHA